MTMPRDNIDAKPVILLIDTALDGCAICVSNMMTGQAVTRHNDDQRAQAQIIVPLIDDALGAAQLQYTDITDIIIISGPGTFTGIRIGLSVARTLAFACHAQLWGISSLQALAYTAQDSLGQGARDMLALVETKRQDFYLQSFDHKAKPINDAKSQLHEDIDFDVQGANRPVLIGNAVDRFLTLRGLDIDENINCQAIDLEKIATHFTQDKTYFTSNVSPIYLRAPDVSQPKNKPRQIKG